MRNMHAQSALLADGATLQIKADSRDEALVNPWPGEANGWSCE